MSRRSLIILILLAIGLVVWLVLSRPAEISPLEKAVDLIRTRTLPADGSATAPTLTRTDWQATAEWTIETDMTWGEYRPWVAAQLGRTYSLVSEEQHQAMFRDTGVNEIHDVRVSRDESDGKIHVHYSVSAW